MPSESSPPAEDAWGPFTGPWKRYHGNPVMQHAWGPGGIVRQGGTFWSFPTVPHVKTKLAHCENSYDWKLVHNHPILTPTKPWEGSYTGAKAALATEDRVLLYYVGKQEIYERIGVATSTDSDLSRANWVKHRDNPVFGMEDVSEDVERVFPGSILRGYGTYYLFYDAGFDYNHPEYPRQYTVNVAASEDGIHFEELAANLIAPGGEDTWESQSVSQSAVRKVSDWWYMVYSGFPEGPSKNAQAFGLARARQLGGPWEKYPHNPIFTATGGDDWDGKFVQHACPVEVNGTWHLYYTANDGETYRQGIAINRGKNWKQR